MAQSGSAFGWGPKGRWFKSSRPDSTGGTRTAPFDLDRSGSTRAGVAGLASATATIEGTEVSYDEEAVADADVLCFYAYSPLYTGTVTSRKQALKKLCKTRGEADLSLDVSGPSSASPGLIAYTVVVENLGPSDVEGYTLVLDTDNMGLQCDSNFEDGARSQGALEAGNSRSRQFTVTCVLEGTPEDDHAVFLEAEVRDPFSATDPEPGNDSDIQTTTVN